MEKMTIKLFLFLSTVFVASAQRGCREHCQSGDDCLGQLTCITGQCADDPDVGTHICQQNPAPGESCKPSSFLQCESGRFEQFDCSPPVSSRTAAVMTLNDFDAGGDGGAESSCDGMFHRNSELIVALSTGWFNNRRRCGKQIRITGPNGKSALAKVVDECDSRNGCDEEHAWQRPCRNNVVDVSEAVWQKLGIEETDAEYGQMNVSWSDA